MVKKKDLIVPKRQHETGEISLNSKLELIAQDISFLGSIH